MVSHGVSLRFLPIPPSLKCCFKSHFDHINHLFQHIPLPREALTTPHTPAYTRHVPHPPRIATTARRRLVLPRSLVEGVQPLAKQIPHEARTSRPKPPSGSIQADSGHDGRLNIYKLLYEPDT